MILDMASPAHNAEALHPSAWRSVRASVIVHSHNSKTQSVFCEGLGGHGMFAHSQGKGRISWTEDEVVSQMPLQEGFTCLWLIASCIYVYCSRPRLGCACQGHARQPHRRGCPGDFRGELERVQADRTARRVAETYFSRPEQECNVAFSSGEKIPIQGEVRAVRLMFTRVSCG